MSNFNLSLAYVLKNEGVVYSNTPHDRGGPTKFGITLVTLSEYCGREVSGEEIRDLNIELATAIYYHLFWTKLCLSMVNHDGIATCIFDIGVNRGVHNAAIMTQECLLRLDFHVDVDGQIGFRTCEQLGKVDPSKFIFQMESLLVQHYKDEVVKHPSQAKFLPGWLARAGRLLSLR